MTSRCPVQSLVCSENGSYYARRLKPMILSHWTDILVAYKKNQKSQIRDNWDILDVNIASAAKNGTTEVMRVEYDASSFLSECVTRYTTMTGETVGKLKKAETPFISATPLPSA